MLHRAARCRVLLKYVEVCLAVTTLCDLVLWHLAEPGISETCEAAGTRLVNEYEHLVGATLTFRRKHGEHYYEFSRRRHGRAGYESLQHCAYEGRA